MRFDILQSPKTDPIDMLFACVTRVYPIDRLFVRWFAVLGGLFRDFDHDLDERAKQFERFGNCPMCDTPP